MRPTRFPDLNELLAAFVAGLHDSLGANLGGAYLQGSFAVGDADEHSDVDFIVAVHEPLTPVQVEALRELHGRLYRLDVDWAQHLEGSYFPTALLRRVDPDATPLLYLDNGASELIWDAHCNTAVVRWSLREHGVVLTGPHPAELVDPVTPEELRSEVRRILPEWLAWAPEPTKAGGMSRWKQPYLVLSMCRFLHTLETGAVVSKRAAGEWALNALDPSWADLVERALAKRPDPWVRVYQPADPGLAEQTLRFVAYAVEVAPAFDAASTAGGRSARRYSTR